MTNEFKKIKLKNETRYVLENASGGASAGGTSAASVNSTGASPTGSLGVLRRRLKELQDKVIRVKGTGTGGQRNTVAQGIIRQGGQTGAGAHQNKKGKATSGSGKGSRDFNKFHSGMGEDRNEETGNTLYLKFKFHRNNWIAYAGYALSPKDLQYKTEIQRSEAIITKLNDLDRFINHLKSQGDFNKRDRIIIVVNSEIYYKEKYPEYIMEFLQMAQDDLYDNVMLKIIEPVEKDERVKSKYNRPNFQMGGKTAEQKPVIRFTVVDPRMKQQMKDAGIPMEGDAFVMPPEKYQAFLEKLKQATKKDPSMFIKRMNQEDDLDEQSIFYGSDKPAQPWHSIEKIMGKSTSMENQDHEISMASSELTSIAKDAAKLLNLVKQRSEEEGLEAWQQSKITKAADFMNSVLQSISGDQDIEDPREYAERSADADAEYYGKMSEGSKNKGLYFNVNRRKTAGISRSKNSPKAPSDQDWKNAAKTAKTNEDVHSREEYEEMITNIGNVMLDLYNRGADKEKIGKLRDRIAIHLKYEPKDENYQRAFMAAFGDTDFEDAKSWRNYPDQRMRGAELGMAEGVDNYVSKLFTALESKIKND